MYRPNPQAPRWRRALAAVWRALRFAFRIFFMLSLAVLPIPIGMSFYRPHRERRNHAAQVLKKEQE